MTAYVPRMKIEDDGLEVVIRDEKYRIEAGKYYNSLMAKLCVQEGIEVKSQTLFQQRECDVLLLRHGKGICAIECTVAHDFDDQNYVSTPYGRSYSRLVNVNCHADVEREIKKVRNSLRKKVQEAITKWPGIPLVVAIDDRTLADKDFLRGMMYGHYSPGLRFMGQERIPITKLSKGFRTPLINEWWFTRCAGVIISQATRYLKGSELIPREGASHLYLHNRNAEYPVSSELFSFAEYCVESA